MDAVLKEQNGLQEVRRIVQEIADILGWSDHVEGVNYVDWIIFYAKAIRAEYAYPQAQLLQWLQLHQQLAETFFLTTASLTRVQCSR